MIATEGKTLEQVVHEILDKLVAQGQPSVKKLPANTENNSTDVDRYTCLYGDGKGNHCAVGWLLPPERQDLMEFFGDLGYLHDSHSLGANDSFIRNNLGVLQEIQHLHDMVVYSGYNAKRDFDGFAGVLKHYYEIDISQYRDFFLNEWKLPE